MEISSTFLEQGLERVNELALPLAVVTCLWLTLLREVPAAAAGRSRRLRKRSRPLVRRAVSGLGLLMTLGSPAAAADGVASRRTLGAGVDLRSEPGRFPPPRLPGPAEPLGARPLPGESPPRVPLRPPAKAVPSRDTVAPPWSRPAAPVHPAVHRAAPVDAASPSPRCEVRSAASDRLFPRWTSAPRAAEFHVDAAPRKLLGWHAVLPGETLWSIAADRLGTDDVRRIARYWPRIHRANRDQVPNPDLLRPGQVLELPPEHG